MKQLLLYNLKNEKGKQIEEVCFSLHIGVLHIQPEEYLEQIGALAGFNGFSKKEAPACGVVFDDEMILFGELLPKEIHTVLDALRNAHLHVALKAALTRHNIHWNSLQLHKELLDEQKALED